jgi:hypothetical protein
MIEPPQAELEPVTSENQAAQSLTIGRELID